MQNKITQTVVLILGILTSIFVTRRLCSGEVFVPALVIAAVSGVFVLLFLKDKYWYMIPAAMVLQLGVIPLGPRSVDAAELIVPACFILMILRFILDRSQNIRFWHPAASGIFLYFWWVVIIFCINPSGLLIFGSESFGARFYYKILIAFLSFLVMLNAKVTNRDCRNILILVFGGMLISVGKGILAWQGRLALAGGAGEEFYTWHQLLAGPALTVSILLFVKYKIEGVLSSPWRLLLYALCFGVALMSGKRMGMLAIMLVPVIQVFLDGHGRNYLIAAGAGGLLVLALLIGASHAGILPKIAQRSVAFVPGMALDRQVKAQTTGGFREYIRGYAWNEVIKKKPLLGLKGYAMDYGEVSSLLLLHGYGEGGGAEGYAVTRSWHTTWLGMAADFGVPAAIFYAIFFFQRWRCNLRCYRLSKDGSWQYLLVGWLMVDTVINLTRTMTSGHSAISPFNDWWKFGLVLALLVAAYKRAAVPEKQITPGNAG